MSKFLTPEKLAENLRNGADGFNETLARNLIWFGAKVEALAKQNASGDDDRPVHIRTRNTKVGKKGSIYKSHQVRVRRGRWESFKSAESGFNVGPRALSGNLRRSIMYQLFINEKNQPGVRISAGIKEPLKYARRIELGGGTPYIEPRFYLGRAFNEFLPQLQKKVNEDVINLIVVF